MAKKVKKAPKNAKNKKQATAKAEERIEEVVEETKKTDEIKEAKAEAKAVEEQSAETPSEEEAASEEKPEETSLKAELEAAQAEASKNLDGWQRATAELANFKKRQEERGKQRREEIIANIISQIFPALDDFDLAFQNLPDTLTEQESNWVEGFQLVQRKLLKILESNNVEIIDTQGKFDPTLHEAVTHEASDEHESDAIIAELRKGYKLNDRILRPALVRVAQ